MAPEDTPQSITPQSITVDAATKATHQPDVATPAIPRRHLLVFTGSSSWMYQLPSEGSVIIGRSETADLQIDDTSVSRQHAKLTVTPEGVSISDLGSQNGTLVDDHKITGEHALHPGEVITIHKATLILHTSATATAPAVILEAPAFSQRLEVEVDRAVRYERTFSVLCLLWPAAPVEPRRLERIVATKLRRIDAAAWTSETTLHVLLAEAGGSEASLIADRIRTGLDPGVRIGHTACPTDGCDVDALIAGAQKVATGAEPGTIAAVSRAHQTFVIGDVRVIVADPSVVRLYALIERLAPVDLPVLITGETGCGKELAATALHQLSRRCARPLISLNCAAIQETLVESELFGHEKGAFSGAVTTKPGLLEAASGSTLFLDEVGELSMATQAKLLRVLETGRMTRVGDVRDREVDVRIVAATNRDLEDEVEVGRFRKDLYFRLTGAQLHLPPLRERQRELPLLAAAFLTDACTRARRGPMALSKQAIAAMLAHGWPGNVRELKNLMHYVAAAHPEPVLTAEHITERLARQRPDGSRAQTGEIPILTPEASTFRPLSEEVRELESNRIRAALEATGGNQTRAAALLSMPVRTFFDKAKQYNLSPRRKRTEGTTDG